MNEQINQLTNLMLTMMILSMGMGMVRPVMLQTRRYGEPKKESERRESHRVKYGIEELPPRGTGLYRQSMWLSPSQRTELERKWGAVATRWGEEMAPVGDLDTCGRLAKFFYESFIEKVGR